MDDLRRYYAAHWMDVVLLELLADHSNVGGQLRRFALDQIAYDVVECSNKKDYGECTVQSLPQGRSRGKIDAFLAAGNTTAVETFWAVFDFAAERHNHPSGREGCHYHDQPAGSPACKFATDEDDESSSVQEHEAD
jgi:hypothetical protein